MHPSPDPDSPDQHPPSPPTHTYPNAPAAQHDAARHPQPSTLGPPDGRGGDGRKGKAREKRSTGRLDAASRKTWDLGGGGVGESDDDVDLDDDGELARGAPVVQTSPLLNIPVESLHEILSYLPPSMLLVLRQVSQALLAAVDDEAIWRACFGRNYLFGRAGAVSRSCLPGPGGKSWKKEALGRERLLDRMSRSKTPVVTYDPRLTSLTTMSLFHPLPPPNTLPHQLRPPSLLSASLLHGLAARSDVTNGKVSKGYLDPWGTTDHTSLWAPPAHASPPTVLALASKRESPTILWGFAEGGVGCTLVAGYATGNGKTSAKTFHSVAGEGHEGPVVSLFGARDGSVVLSGGADGRVILWGVPPASAGRVQNTLKRLWVGQAAKEERGREIVRRVCWDERAGGTVACVTDEGFLTVWAGVLGSADKEPAPARATWADEELQASTVGDRDRTITLALDIEDLPAASGAEPAAPAIRVLLHASPSNTFRQLSGTWSPTGAPEFAVKDFAPPSASAAELTSFHSDFTVPLPPGLPFQHSTSLAPTPALSRIPSAQALDPAATQAPPSADEHQVVHLPMSTSIERRALGSVGQGKFVVTGDGEGVVRLWNWDDGRLVRQWDAIDGKVTALECTMGLVLVGSLEGVLKVYDPLANPPALLRTFNDRSATRHLRPHLAAGALDPALWRVQRIVLERDQLVACVGGKILSWKMGSGGREREGRSEWKGKVVNKKAGTSGWAGMRTPNGKGGPSQHELQSEISSARQAHREAQESLQTAIAKDQAMKAKVVGGLDLTDEEQIAYAMLISQEEEDARQRSASSNGPASRPSSAQASTSTSPPVNGQGEDDMDESLRAALERSLLDQSCEAEEEQFEMLFDEDDGLSSTSSSRRAYPASPVLRPIQYGGRDDAGPSFSRRSSLAPTPVFGSLDDPAEWPAMLSSTPPSTTGSPLPSTKGKQLFAPNAPSPIPFASAASGQAKWSAVARSPPSASSACRSPSLLAQASPSLRAVGSSSAAGGGGGGRPMTREEREDEELRLVLEMSLNDQ